MKLIFREHFSDSFEVLVHPSRFFKRVSRKDMYDGAFKFAIKNIAVFSVIIGLFLLLLGPDKKTLFVSVILAVGLTVAGVAELFVFSLSFHVFLKVLGARKSFDETFSVVAYCTAVLLYAWAVPLLVLLPFHALYIASAGFVEVHKVSRLRGVGAMVAPIVIGALLLFMLVMSAGFGRIVDVWRIFYSVKVL
ncbi:MAG: YIP1 family protein [archaeon]|nr:YIP1 family protein [archaeon]